PPGEEGVVAAELLIVLVDSPGAVVFDEQQTSTALARVARNLKDRVGADGAWPRVAQALGRPLVVKAQLVAARGWRRFNCGLPVPGEQVAAKSAAVGEHPRVELQLVQDVAE